MLIVGYLFKKLAAFVEPYGLISAHKGPPLLPLLILMNAGHTFTLQFFRNNFSLIYALVFQLVS
jgi:hypothetical protein